MDRDLAADFVRRFEKFWQAPVVERLDTVLASDARLSAPMVSTTYGIDAGKRTFAELFGTPGRHGLGERANAASSERPKVLWQRRRQKL